ncbi:MAG: PfkB family carbohydrate kinase [Bacteroidetes bacterium]|nr:PfkB family carbohydrate kinase [Bacteroidota bacterium]MDA1120544.1 PfkB family carbohydrate kinase [Bacteroidota bacterium]
MKVLSFGEVLWDIIGEDAHLGGAPLNFAAHSVQCGGQSSMLSRLGNDDFGRDAGFQIGKLGVDTNLLQIDQDHPTGTVPVTLVDGQPDYYITPNAAYDFIDLGEAKAVRDESNFEVLYYGTLVQRGQSGDALKKILDNYKFRLKFCDINMRKDCYSEEIIRFSLGHATVAKLNEYEVIEVGQMLSQADFVPKLLGVFPQLEHVILTVGGEGCYVFQDHTLHHIKSEPVHVVDAIGAGDSFSAAFMYSFFKSGDVLKSAEIGNKVGGFVASSAGAIPKYPEAIVKLLQSI